MVAVAAGSAGVIASNPLAAGVAAKLGVPGVKLATGTGALNWAAWQSLDITSLGSKVAAIGEGTVVAVGSLGGGSSAGNALATKAGPIGCGLVGCSEKEDCGSVAGYTWDCWKPIVRDPSPQPSQGITLRSLAAHPNVQSMSLDQEGLFVENTFGERFHLAPVSVEGALAFHASILSS